jgi:hypothetical protein
VLQASSDLTPCSLVCQQHPQPLHRHNKKNKRQRKVLHSTDSSSHKKVNIQQTVDKVHKLKLLAASQLLVALIRLQMVLNLHKIQKERKEIARSTEKQRRTMIADDFSA